MNATLGNYEDSVHDLSVAKDMEPSIEGKKQIERELDMLARHHEKKIAKPASQKSVEIPGKMVTFTQHPYISYFHHTLCSFVVIFAISCREELLLHVNP